MKKRSGFLKLSLGRLLLLGAASLSLPTLSLAVNISITGIETFHQGDSLDADGSNARVIDGSGMTKPDADDPSTWTINSTAWADDWQGFSTPGTPNETWVVFDLGAPAADLMTMYLWNVNEATVTNRGTSGFQVFHATAPTVPPPATSATVTPYDFASGGWTSLGYTYLPESTGADDPGQSFDISGAAGARYIGIEIIGHHGGTRVGLGEAAFTDTADANAFALGPLAATVPIAAIFGHEQGDTFDGDGSILRVIDGTITATNPADPSQWKHGNSWPEDWQGNAAPGATPNGTWAVLDFGETVSGLEALHLWNVNEPNAIDRGVNEFRLHYATAPDVTPPVADDTADAYDFTSGGWTVFGGTRTLAQASAMAGEQANGSYDLSGMPAARYLGIEIISNHGSTFRTGLAHAVVVKSSGPPPPFAITDIAYDGGVGKVSVTWNSEAGVTYGIEASTTLTPNGMLGGWQEIDDFTASGPSSTYEHAPVAPEVLPANLNYRVRRYDG